MLGGRGVRWAIRRRGFVTRPLSVGTARRRGGGRSSRRRCHSRSRLSRRGLSRRGERPGPRREPKAVELAVKLEMALDVRRQRCRRRQ